MAFTVRPQEEMDPADMVKLIEAEEDTGEDIIEELSEEISSRYTTISVQRTRGDLGNFGAFIANILVCLVNMCHLITWQDK